MEKKLEPIDCIAVALAGVLKRILGEGIDPTTQLNTEDFLAICRVVWLDAEYNAGNPKNAE
jgi:hypothetical protein